MKNIEREITWHKYEPGNCPSLHAWFLVFGSKIEKGRMVKTFRIAYHQKSFGFQDCDDMQVEFWAELSNPI